MFQKRCVGKKVEYVPSANKSADAKSARGSSRKGGKTSKSSNKAANKTAGKKKKGKKKKQLQLTTNYFEIIQELSHLVILK